MQQTFTHFGVKTFSAAVWLQVSNLQREKMRVMFLSSAKFIGSSMVTCRRKNVRCLYRNIIPTVIQAAVTAAAVVAAAAAAIIVVIDDFTRNLSDSPAVTIASSLAILSIRLTINDDALCDW